MVMLIASKCLFPFCFSLPLAPQLSLHESRTRERTLHKQGTTTCVIFSPIRCSWLFSSPKNPKDNQSPAASLRFDRSPPELPLGSSTPGTRTGRRSQEETMRRDIEAEYAPCCRICLSTDNYRGFFGAGHELISPCRCKGSQQFVHRSCLDQWRAVKEGTAFSHCTTCKAQFHLLVELLEDDMCLRMKFWFFVSRDIFLIFAAIQAVIVAIAGVAYLLDRDGKFRNRFTDWMLSKHPLPFYYCVGVVMFFALVGLVGLLSHCFSCNYRANDPSCLPEPECSYGCLDCETSRSGSGEDDGLVCVLIMVVVLVFALLGIFCGFIAATMAFQKIMQRHYHILKKKELTKVYVVEDLKRGLLDATQDGPKARAAPEGDAPHVAACCGYNIGP